MCVCCYFVTDVFELTQCALCFPAGLLSQLSSCSSHGAARMSPALVAQRRSSSTSQKIKVDFDQSTGEHFANTDCAGERMLFKWDMKYSCKWVASKYLGESYVNTAVCGKFSWLCLSSKSLVSQTLTPASSTPVGTWGSSPAVACSAQSWASTTITRGSWSQSAGLEVVNYIKGSHNRNTLTVNRPVTHQSCIIMKLNKSYCLV